MWEKSNFAQTMGSHVCMKVQNWESVTKFLPEVQWDGNRACHCMQLITSLQDTINKLVTLPDSTSTWNHEKQWTCLSAYKSITKANLTCSTIWFLWIWRLWNVQYMSYVSISKQIGFKTELFIPQRKTLLKSVFFNILLHSVIIGCIADKTVNNPYSVRLEKHLSAYWSAAGHLKDDHYI
jgi:hypothetical protein